MCLVVKMMSSVIHLFMLGRLEFEVGKFSIILLMLAVDM